MSATKRGASPFSGKSGLSLFLFLLAAPALAFDANGVKLGGGEPDVVKAFPSARCKPMEWKTEAADRRCDDGRISFGGAKARITVYLKGGVIEAFNVGFENRELERVTAHAKAKYGPPMSEKTEVFAGKGDPRKVLKMRWEKGGERAVLTSQEKQKRGELEVWRGKFDTEVYRVR
jgi:hypothetical protein